MSNLPVCIIVTAAAKANAEAVISAYRGGSVQFARGLIPADTPSPTHQSPATHWLMFDASTDQDNVVVYQGFAGGDLPPLAVPGAAWGDAGLVSAQDALAAVNASAMQVYSASGDVEPADFVAGILSSRSLIYVPDIVLG